MTLSSSVCMTRTTTSSLFFDAAVATVTAWLDETWHLRESDEEWMTKPTWFFYKFRMITQTTVLAYNFARLVYEAYANQGAIAVLCAVRCACLVGVIARHYYVCNYRWDMLIRGKAAHLEKLQVSFMFVYLSVGAIAGGIDPFFASDSVPTILYFLGQFVCRGLSVLLAKPITKLFTRAIYGLVVSAYVSPLILFSLLGALKDFAICAANPTSIFFSDRLLTGLIQLLQYFAGIFGAWRRERVNNDIRFKNVSSYIHESGRSIAVAPTCDDDETGRSNTAGDPASVKEESEGPDFPPFRTILDDPLSQKVSISAEDSQLIVGIDRRRAFTEAKIFMLVSPVGCTFMVMQAAELAMSMGIYQATGAPANWCAPFSMADVNRGFQVVLDFLI